MFPAPAQPKSANVVVPLPLLRPPPDFPRDLLPPRSLFPSPPLTPFSSPSSPTSFSVTMVYWCHGNVPWLLLFQVPLTLSLPLSSCLLGLLRRTVCLFLFDALFSSTLPQAISGPQTTIHPPLSFSLFRNFPCFLLLSQTGTNNPPLSTLNRHISPFAPGNSMLPRPIVMCEPNVVRLSLLSELSPLL